MGNPLLAFLERLLVVRAQDPDGQRRGRLLSILLLSSLVLAFILTAINLAQIVTAATPARSVVTSNELLQDCLALLLMSFLLYLNRTGRTRLASSLFLATYVLACTALFGIETLDRVLLLYATPILASSFIISPGSSFVVAVVSALGYTWSYRANSLPQTYNYVSMLGLGLMATVAWLIANSLERALHDAQRSLTREHAAQEKLRAQVAERERADEQLRRQNEYLGALHEVTLGLMNRLDLTDVLEAIVTRAGQLLGTPHGYIYLVEPEKDLIEAKVALGVFAGQAGYRMKRGEGVGGQVWQNGQPLLVDDYDTWPGRSPGYPYGVFHSVVGVPLTYGAQIIGAIGMAHVEPGLTFRSEEVTLLSEFAQLASVALDNARLYTAAQQELAERKRAEEALRASQVVLRRYADEQVALYESALRLNTQLEMSELLRLIVGQAITLLGAEAGEVDLYDPQRDVLFTSIAVGPQFVELANRTLKAGEGLAGQAFASRRSIALEDYNTWSGRVALYENGPHRKAMLAVPLLGRVDALGVLLLAGGAHKPIFSERDTRLAEMFAVQAAIALENVRLLEAERAARQRLETLYRVGQTLNSTLDTTVILDRLTDEALRATGASHGAAVVARPDLGYFEWSSPRGYSPEQEARVRSYRMPLDHGLNGRAYRTGQMICVDDVTADPDYVGFNSSARSELVIPIVRGGQVLGNLDLQSYDVAAFRNVNVGFLQAVTDQVAIALENARLYEAMSRSQREWEATFQAITDCICICDAGLGIVRANRALTERLNTSLAALTGRQCDEVLHCSADSLQITSDEQHVGSVREEHILGGVFEISSYPLRDEQGKIVGSVQMLKDIGERKALEEMWRRYEFIVNTSKDFMALIGPDYEYEAVNEAYCQAQSKRREELVGRQVPDVWGLEAYVASIKEPLDTCLAGNEVHYQKWFSFSVLGQRYMDVSYYPYWGTEGTVRAVVVSRDVTDRKQAEDALMEERALLAQRVQERTAELSAANAQLARASRLKDEFLANMSHELRTPLTGILGLSEALQKQVYGPLSEQQIKTLRAIEESGRHLLDLINDILDLSKIEAGRLELQMSLVIVSDMCQSSLRMIKQVAQKKKLLVSFDMDPAATKLQADNRRLKQMLVNLLSNAVKFTPVGGSIGLQVRGDAERRVVNFAVWDTGIGIAPEDLSRLFRPFVQLDSRLAREYSGTGLGLSLVHRMADMHGGSMSVESEPGKGSRFTISLPWAGPRDMSQTSSVMKAVRRPAAQRRPALEGQAPADGPMILLAEDNEITIAMLVDFLQSRSFRVVVARNGEEAIERAREDRPALILMDVQMPGVDGLEATRRIRADTELKPIPIIALTALAMPGDRENCLAIGANDYLSKPLSLEGLAQAIEQQLTRLTTPGGSK